MQEHTDRGREIARQILNMAKAYRRAELTNVHGEPLDMNRVGGLMKSVIAAQLREWGAALIAAEDKAQVDALLPAAIHCQQGGDTRWHYDRRARVCSPNLGSKFL
jgi:hypothetical protein